MHSNTGRRFSSDFKGKPMPLIKQFRKVRKEAPPMEKPEIVTTHRKHIIIWPEMTCNDCHLSVPLDTLAIKI
uniref:40S ribosomal protein S15 n=1 Tax=Glossina palpalis gambiensis TaxID=67801 RepID=A0A1B0AZN3_9MUSC